MSEDKTMRLVPAPTSLDKVLCLQAQLEAERVDNLRQKLAFQELRLRQALITLSQSACGDSGQLTDINLAACTAVIVPRDEAQ